MMKALSIGMGGAVLLALAAGCQPQLAETGMGDAELQWYSYVSESYPSFRPPRTAAPATQDKYTTLPNGGQSQPAGGEATGELVADEEEIVLDGSVTGTQVQLETAADDPAGTTPDEGIVLEPEEGEQPVADAPVAEEPAAPGADAAKVAPEQKYTEYVVKPGDTLSGIAKKFYKDGRLFGRIYDANKDVIPNPNKLPLGAKIRIPQP